MSSYKKYNNVTTNRFGKRFDSDSECKRFARLKVLEDYGVIKGLCVQVEFPLVRKMGKRYKYICDFAYTYQDEYIVEDVKNPRLLFNKTFLAKYYAMLEQYCIMVTCIHPRDVMIFPARKMNIIEGKKAKPRPGQNGISSSVSTSEDGGPWLSSMYAPKDSPPES